MDYKSKVKIVAASEEHEVSKMNMEKVKVSFLLLIELLNIFNHF